MDSPINNEFLWLVSDEAVSLLNAAQDAFVNNTNPLKIAKLIRRSVSPTRAALVMEQAQLRIRAKKKFPLADQMFFTQRGLEQSSAHSLAQYKARKFRSLASVADICCGIGGDLLALALRGPTSSSVTETVGVDIDAATAMFARRNLELVLAESENTGARADVRQTDFESLDLSQYDGLHLDPDRRKGRRTTDGRHFSPGLDEVFGGVATRQLVCVKVAPATPQADYLPAEVHREWLGDPRECKQQLLWLNSDHLPGRRSATVVSRDGQAHSVDCGGQEKFDRCVADQMMQYLYEPRSVVLAAGLEDRLAAKLELRRIAFDIPYFVSEQEINDPLMARFKVVRMMKLDMKLIQKYLTDHDVGQIELKQRGIDMVTYDRARKLKFKGKRKASLILTRYGPKQKRCAIFAKRHE